MSNPVPAPVTGNIYRRNIYDQIMRYVGIWNAYTQYIPGDVVFYSGSMYICTVQTTNNVPPDASYWTTGLISNIAGLTNHRLVITGPSGQGDFPAGTTGQVIQSKGSSADPAWTPYTLPTANGGVAGRALRSDGTNYVDAALNYNDITNNTGAPLRSTTKVIVSTTAATDLWNGAIQFSGGQIGTSGWTRITSFGDWVHTSGSLASGPKFQLFLQGGSALLDTGAPTSAVPSSSTRFPWKAVVEIMNLGAANSQYISMYVELGISTIAGSTFNQNVGTTGVGRILAIQGGSGTNAVLKYMMSATSSVNTASTTLVEFKVTTPSSTLTDFTCYGAIAEIL